MHFFLGRLSFRIGAVLVLNPRPPEPFSVTRPPKGVVANPLWIFYNKRIAMSLLFPPILKQGVRNSSFQYGNMGCCRSMCQAYILSNIFVIVKIKNHGVTPPLPTNLTTSPTHTVPPSFILFSEKMRYRVSIDYI